MLKKGLMIGVVAILTLVAFSAVMMSDDSEAAGISVVCNGVEINGIYYDLCMNDNKHSDYGPPGKLIAFVSGGDPSKNAGYPAESCGGVMKIPSTVKYSSKSNTPEDEYEVVGIRNNAFQANKNTEGKTIDPTSSPLYHLETVIIPETMVAIGVGVKGDIYGFDTNTSSFCFSRCLRLNKLVIEGESPSLKQISKGAFQNTSITTLDLSQATDLKILSDAFATTSGFTSNLIKVNISSAITLQYNAFANANSIKEIVMPARDIDFSAFPNSLRFHDEDGIYISTGSGLAGKSFKYKYSDGGNKIFGLGYVATFDANGGKDPVDKDGNPIFVLLKNEDLPSPPSRAGYDFIGWKDDSSGIIVDKMPGYNATFTAVWGVGKPDTCSLVYDGTIQTAYTDTDAYTVIGNEGKDAGEYQATFTLKDNYQWEVEGTAPCDVSWLINPATIIGDIQQDGSLTYDGTPQRADVYITLVSVADEPITITYSLAADGAYSIAVPTFTDVGVHTVYYKAEAPNHDVKTGSFTVTVSAPHNSDTEGGDQVLLLLIGGIAMIAVAILVAPFIFGRP